MLSSKVLALLAVFFTITTIVFAALYGAEKSKNSNGNNNAAAAQPEPSSSSTTRSGALLKSVSRIQFDDTSGTLFVADWKQEKIFAFELVSKHAYEFIEDD